MPTGLVDLAERQAEPRSRPEEDVVVFPRLSTSGMDPSAFRLEGTDSFWNSGLGIDATKPYRQPFPDVVEIPGVDKVNLDEEI